MISLAAADAEEALLENRIATVPEREGEAETLVVVADTGDAILSPAIGAGAGMIVREEFPGFSAGAVVLSGVSPASFGEIRAPAPPVAAAPVGLLDTLA